jgi:ferredoxin-NADP reductase
MGGGIGITPMIAMAHELSAKGADFAFHYSGRSRDAMGFLPELAAMPWADKVHLHITDEGRRADMATIMLDYQPGWHVYTCGADRYMSAVMESAEAAGFPEEARHLEYFAVPDMPDYENHAFTVKLAKSGTSLTVPADQNAAEVLNENGYQIELKCSDGICGVCKCGVLSGEVEHRDFVLSKAQRESEIILCQSRAALKDGVIELDL